MELQKAPEHCAGTTAPGWACPLRHTSLQGVHWGRETVSGTEVEFGTGGDKASTTLRNRTLGVQDRYRQTKLATV